MKLTPKQKYNIVNTAYQISFLCVFVSFIPFLMDLMSDWTLDGYYFPIFLIIWLGITWFKGTYFYYSPDEKKIS